MKKLAALACAGTLLGAPIVATTGGAAEATTAPPPPPLALTMPSRVVGYVDGARAEVDLTPTYRTGADAFEIYAQRSAYSRGIVATWKRPGGDVALPAGSMKDFSGLSTFLRVWVTDAKGKTLVTRGFTQCLNGYGQRVVPEGAPRSKYPGDCPTNPFTLGSVQGIPAGWAVQTYLPSTTMKLKPGAYTLHTTITAPYRAALHIPLAAGRTTSRLRIMRDPGGEERTQAARTTRGTRAAQTRRSTVAPKPNAARPTGAQGVSADTPKPDLRSLPAWGISISPNGNYLEFGATVWNGGNSPLVVDGFRRGSQQIMDAFQYFFDPAGNQVGYQNVGTMEYDARPSHQHWHFEDFARYRLLNADKTVARRSQKEAFCLANTDAVDYTVPGAAWQPDGTDLSTACGDVDSIAVREELSSGSGDTYSQIRAGQSFNLTTLPNGYYYISVEANPFNRLVESNTANNVSLRKVLIGGKPGHRTVKLFKVGLVDDRNIGAQDF